MTGLLESIKTTYRRYENPLLMKELRQTVRSRIYVYVFMGIIFTCLFLMTMFLLFQRGQTGISEGVGKNSFVILYIPFAIVALLAIPMTAFLSQLHEVEQDCLELIQVTNLTPGQIVRGKIIAAVVKLLLFLTSMVPFFAFTYLLRGISIVAILLAIGFTLLLSVLLIAIYVFFSMLVQYGASKVLIMLLLVGISLFVGYFLLGIGHEWFFRGSPGPISSLLRLNGYEFAGMLSMILAIWGSLVFFFHQTALAMTMPETRNRSWPVRMAFLPVILVFCIPPFLLSIWHNEILAILFGFSIPVWLLLTISALIWSTEDDEIPRTVAESNRWYNSIPYLSRLFLPGGVWGYHFSLMCCLFMVALALGGSILEQNYLPNRYDGEYLMFHVIVGSYVVLYSGIAFHFSRVMRSMWPDLKLRIVRGIIIVSIVVSMVGPMIIQGLFDPAGMSDTDRWFAVFNPFIVMSNALQEKSVLRSFVMLSIVNLILFTPTLIIGRKILQKEHVDTI